MKSSYMKKIIRLTESDLFRIVKRVIKENSIYEQSVNNEKTANDNSYIYFDGTTLKLIINGNVKKQWKAWSGRTKWNANTPYQRKLADTLSKIEFMKVKDQGPIPEGQYYIDQVQQRTNGNSLTFCANKDWSELGKIYMDEYKKIGDNHNFNTGTAQDMIAWGNFRMPIKTKSGTNTFGRGNFYLHGGGIAGSIGCIDLVDKIDDFVSEYRNYLSTSGKKSLDLYVDYSGKMKLPTTPMVLKSPENVGEPKSERIPKSTDLKFTR